MAVRRSPPQQQTHARVCCARRRTNDYRSCRLTDHKHYAIITSPSELQAIGVCIRMRIVTGPGSALPTVMCVPVVNIAGLTAREAVDLYLRAYAPLVTDARCNGESLTVTGLYTLNDLEIEGFGRPLATLQATGSGLEFVLFLDTDGATPRIMCHQLAPDSVEIHLDKVAFGPPNGQ